MMTIEDNIEYYIQHGIRNINCGMLRQIGKTEVLKKIIRRFKELNSTKTIAIILPNRQLDDYYRDVLIDKTVEYVTTPETIRLCLKSLRDRLLIFSDEIPKVEELLDRHGLLNNFICGLYSCSYSSYKIIVEEQQNINFPDFKKLDLEKLNKYKYINAT